ncbi:MAG: hypothetical protein AB7S38_22745 [Vulcanimicrobiota bacterium]
MSPRRSSRLAPAALLLVVAAAALWAYPRPLRDLSPGDRIEVIIQGPAQAKSLIWQREGAYYRSPLSIIPVEEMNALRQAAMASRQPCDLLAEVGFVADEQLLLTKARERFPWLGGEPPTIDLAAAARDRADSRPSSDFQYEVVLELGGEPNLRLSARTNASSAPRLFPVWQVEADNMQWETRCPKLSQLGRVFCPIYGRNSGALDDWSEWNESFYDEQAYRLGVDWGRQWLEESHQSWPGYTQLADSYYEVVAFDPIQEQEWAVSLFQVGPVAVKYATFTFTASEGLDWNEVLAEIERARLASRHQKWIRYPLPSNDSLHDAWTEAGLQGRPAFHLVHNKTDVLLSADGDTCLIDMPDQALLQVFGLASPRSGLPVRLVLEGQAKRLVDAAYVHEVESVKIE